MNIIEFKDKVNQQGLARSNRWVVRVHAPRGLTASGNAISNFLSQGGNRVNINLPGLDSIDAGIETLNNLNVDLGPVNIDHNFKIPTLGYALTNMGGKMEALNLFTSACQIPSRDIVSSEFKEYGEVRHLGFNHQHADLTINYYCSEDLRERSFFEQWQDVIFNPRNKRMGYYKDYTSKIEIIKYDASWSNQTARYEFNEAYPTNVGTLEMNQGEANVLELTMTFKFRNYTKTL